MVKANILKHQLSQKICIMEATPRIIRYINCKYIKLKIHNLFMFPTEKITLIKNKKLSGNFTKMFSYSNMSFKG